MKDSVLLKPFPDPVCIVSQAVLNIDDTGEIAYFHSFQMAVLDQPAFGKTFTSSSINLISFFWTEMDVVQCVMLTLVGLDAKCSLILLPA